MPRFIKIKTVCNLIAANKFPNLFKSSKATLGIAWTGSKHRERERACPTLHWGMSNDVMVEEGLWQQSDSALSIYNSFCGRRKSCDGDVFSDGLTLCTLSGAHWMNFCEKFFPIVWLLYPNLTSCSRMLICSLRLLTSIFSWPSSSTSTSKFACFIIKWIP